MMEPPRLLAERADEFESALLGSTSLDEPDPHALERAAVALGIGASTLTAAGSSAALAGSGVTSSGTTLATNKFVAFVIIKWLGIGLASGLAVTGSVEVLRDVLSSRTEEAPRTVALPPRPTASASMISPVRVKPAIAESATDEHGLELQPSRARQEPKLASAATSAVSPPAPRPERSSTVNTDRSAPPLPSVAAFDPATRSGAASTGPASSLALEVAALQTIRAALAARDPRRALKELDAYAQGAHAHALGTEAAVLRVEALLQAGDRAGAQALARRLLGAQPNGPHTPRLRDVVAGH
jgi:hypothetical protein